MLEGYIEIEKLSVYAAHGVMPQERSVGNLFEVTALLRYDMEQAACLDDVRFALDYSQVVAVIRRVMAQPSALLENVVLRIKEAVMGEFPVVTGGRIKIAKVTPPIPGRMASVSVAIEW